MEELSNKFSVDGIVEQSNRRNADELAKLMEQMDDEVEASDELHNGGSREEGEPIDEFVYGDFDKGGNDSDKGVMRPPHDPLL